MSRTEETSVGCVVGICSLVSQACRFLRILLSFLSDSSMNRDHNHRHQDRDNQNSAWSCFFIKPNQVSTTSTEMNTRVCFTNHSALMKPKPDSLCWFWNLHLLWGLCEYWNPEDRYAEINKDNREENKLLYQELLFFTLSNSVHIQRFIY